MSRLVAWCIRFPIWANVFMWSIVVFGLFSLSNMRSSFFPESESNLILVQVVYPGTSPEEVEQSVVQRIEENLRGTPGIEQITSVSSENAARITIKALENFDIDDVLTDVKNAVDRVNPWPANAEQPLVYRRKARSRSISLALAGDMDLWALKELAEEFRDDLIAIDGLSQVNISGHPARELAVEVREADMRRYKLDIAQLATSVRKANLDLSGGKIETRSEELLIRSYGQRDLASELESIVLRALPDGRMLLVRDVAKVREKWEDNPKRTRLSGRRALVLDIDKTMDEDILFVADTVRAMIPLFQAKHPQVFLQIIDDSTVHLRGRIDLLKRNGIIGFILVALLLSLFMNVRVSFWVAIGIPISFAGMFAVVAMLGITINVLSLFGMILVVGMLVDDAIVVAERIYQEAEKGSPPLQAALAGVKDVMAPVFTAVLTTMLAFLPFFFFEGHIGKMVWEMSVVIIAALAFSLFESFFILPAHLAHSRGLRVKERVHPIRLRLENAYRVFTQYFTRTLRFSLHYKYALLAVPPAALLVTLGLFQGGFLKFAAFPHIDRDNIRMSITLPTGSQEGVTDSLLQWMEGQIWELNKALKAERADKKDVVLSIRRTLGSNSLGDEGAHAGALQIELLENAERQMKSYVLQNRLADSLGNIPELSKMSFTGGFWGKPITLSLLGEDVVQLRRASALIRKEMSGMPRLTDIVDNDVEGNREVRLRLKPAAHALGFSLQDVSQQVRSSFFGQEVQRLQRGKDELKIWVRLAEADRRDLGDLEELRLRSPAGGSYPLAAIADWKIERGIVNIVHLDGKREIQIEADMKNPEDSPPELLAELKNTVIPKVLAQVSGVRVNFEGQERENRRFKQSALRAVIPALIGIYIVLILVFRSWLQAFIIIIMIPTGAMGAFWGHWLIGEILPWQSGMKVSRLSMFGIIALIGIVINDSIVYLDKINKNLRAGQRVFRAVVDAGSTRLRPILLTTLTTVFGMMPLILERSMQAQFLIPMAVSVSFGLLFGSLFILFLVPASFLFLNDLRTAVALIKYRFTGDENLPVPTNESVEPAFQESIIHWEES